MDACQLLTANKGLCIKLICLKTLDKLVQVWCFLVQHLREPNLTDFSIKAKPA